LGYAPVAAESTPYYLYHPLAPARAADLAPDAIVVALLRDPVERAFSHWKERCQHTETLSFADAVAAEADRCRGEEERILADPSYVSFPHRHQSYVAQSCYVPMIERWQAHYSADQFIVWISEEFYARPQEHSTSSPRLGCHRGNSWMRSRTTASMHPTCRPRRAPSSPSASAPRSTR
jgi:hypothetical protein